MSIKERALALLGRKCGQFAMLESPIHFATIAIVAGALTGVALAAPPTSGQSAIRAKAVGARVGQGDAAGIETTAGAMSVVQSEAGLTLDSEGGYLVLDYNGKTRRMVVERLFAASGAAITWNDESHAAELIKGRVTGSLDEVMAALLPHSNYVIVRRIINSELRIVSVVILGPSLQSPNDRPPQVVASVRTGSNARAVSPGVLFDRAMEEARRAQE